MERLSEREKEMERERKEGKKFEGERA